MSQMPTLGTPAPATGPSPYDLGAAEAQLLQARRRQEMAQALMQMGYVPNSGAVGALAQIVGAWKAGKIDKEAGGTVTEALRQKIAIEEQERQAELAAKEAEYQRGRKDKREDMDYAEQHREGSVFQAADGRVYRVRGNVAEPVHIGAGAPQLPPNQYAIGEEGQVELDKLPPAERQAAMLAMSGGDYHVDPASGGVVGGRSAGLEGGFGSQLVGRVPPQPGASPSELERRIGLARQLGATDDDVRRMVIGREGAAAGSKPMPVGALKEDLAVEDALGGAQAAFTLAAKHLDRLAKHEVDPSLPGRAGANVREFFNSGNDQTANLREMQADKLHMVNESLRLNKGVQTEGDAQRATQELMNASDYVTTVRAWKRLVEINKRAVMLQQHKREMIRRNYGQGAGQSPEAIQQEMQSPSNAGWSIKVKASP